MSDSPSPTDALSVGPRDWKTESPWASAFKRFAQAGNSIVQWINVITVAGGYLILLVTFGVRPARVEGASMSPTLEDQDRLLVNLFVYRFREARPGDIVIFHYPPDPTQSLVKRVIAEEGDTVSIVDGRVYVNEVPLNDSYIPTDFRSHDDWGPELIPEGYDFVMGDHRNVSSDSRRWGMVPKKYIVGKVQLRWWPFVAVRIF